VHNLIEPAVASNIIFFGPNYRNSNLFDAEGLMNRNAAFKIDSGEDFLKKLSAFFQNEEKFLSSADEGTNFIKENSGAVSKLLERLINE
jgi:3-deoxy-D-manno-octulosonic-acid transferase